MKSFIRQRGQVLIIYLSTLFIGGSSLALGVMTAGKSLEDIAKDIKTYVHDTARQNHSLKLIEQWEEEGELVKKEYEKQRETLLDLIKNHQTKKTTFDNIIKKILKNDQQTSRRLLDIQYGLREQMTAEEWSKVFSGNIK